MPGTEPEWQRVQSSNVDAVMYDPEARVLSVRFHSGGEYSYRNVPPDVARGLVDAESPGRYFASNIRGNYSHE